VTRAHRANVSNKFYDGASGKVISLYTHVYMLEDRSQRSKSTMNVCRKLHVYELSWINAGDSEGSRFPSSSCLIEFWPLSKLPEYGM
jgi:hypothetical protein